MPRVNERCIEHTPEEYRVKACVIEPGGEILGTHQDTNGAKIHCCWVRVDQDNCVVLFDYLSRTGDYVLETRGPLPLEKSNGDGHYNRFQFGTYKAELPLPAMNLRVRIQNHSSEPATVTLYGMSQLQ